MLTQASTSCFRMAATLLMLTMGSYSFASGNSLQDGNSNQPKPPHGPPPQVAIDACANQAEGAACSFTGRRGETVSGSCHTPPRQSSLACVPAHPPMPNNQSGGDNRPQGY